MSKDTDTIFTVAAIAAGGYLIYNLTSEIKSSVSEVTKTLTGISTAFQGAGTGISTAVQGTGAGISTAFQGAGTGISTTLTGLGTGVSDVVEDVTSITGGISNLGTTITTETAENTTAYANIFQSLFEGILGFIDKSREIGGDLLDKTQSLIDKRLSSSTEQPKEYNYSSIDNVSTSSKHLKSLSSIPRKSLKITVNQPKRDSSGLTAWDRRIVANKLKRAARG